MAEILGTVASILQVVSVGVEVSSTLFKYAKKFHNSGKEIEEIASQVEKTIVSLRTVDALLRDPTTQTLHTQKLYDDTTTVSNGCLEVFRELDNYVKSFEPRSGLKGISLRSKARWLTDSSKVRELGHVLRRYGDVLHLMISVMAIVEGRRAATKDDLQALEADLKLLALTNKDLSHSNKTLTDTIAAISQPSVSHAEAKATSAPVASLTTDNQGTSRAMPLASLLAMSPADLLPVVPQTQSPSNGMTNHLQRCMNSVQELALSISCALDALHGREKTGSSDIHGSYAKLVADVQQLTSKVQCIHCKRTVAWSHLGPIKPGPVQAGACICMRVATPSTWQPCHDQILPAPNHLNTSNPRPTYDPVLDKLIEPYDIPMVPDIRKRSFSELSQVQPPPPAAPQMHMMPTEHQSPRTSAYETSPGGIEDPRHKVQRMTKRGDLPQAHDGKYYRNSASECAVQYSGRNGGWGEANIWSIPISRIGANKQSALQLEGFTYSGGLLRHERDVHGQHGDPKDRLQCTVSSCKRHIGKGFTREEDLNEHIRRVHGTTTADVVTPTGRQNRRSSTNITSSVGNRNAERDPQHVIERQDTRDSAHLANQIWTSARTEQTSAIQTRISPGPHQYPQHPARGNANLAAQTQSSPPRPRSTSQDLTPAIRDTTERPYTPAAQVQPQGSHHTSATSLHAPYTYANAPYIDHNNPFYPDASFGAMSTEVQMLGPSPQVGQVGQMAPQAESASPISECSAPPSPQVSHLIQMRPQCGTTSPIEMASPFSRPSSPSSVTSTGVRQQTGRKRSHEDAFPRCPGQTAMSQGPPKAIRVNPDDNSAILEPKSRLNYGKKYNIEHNFSVKNLGMLSPENLAALMEQFTAVFLGRENRPDMNGEGPKSKQEFLNPPVRRLKVCELSAETIEHPVDSINDGKSIENLSGIQALLLRWFEASAAAVVLGPSAE